MGSWCVPVDVFPSQWEQILVLNEPFVGRSARRSVPNGLCSCEVICGERTLQVRVTQDKVTPPQGPHKHGNMRLPSSQCFMGYSQAPLSTVTLTEVRRCPLKLQPLNPADMSRLN